MSYIEMLVHLRHVIYKNVKVEILYKQENFDLRRKHQLDISSFGISRGDNQARYMGIRYDTILFEEMLC